MTNVLPETVVDCGGCGKELNLLSPYLKVMLKPEVAAVTLREISGGDNAVSTQEIGLGTRSGRGVLLQFHDFDCLNKWVSKRKGLSPVLEFHKETGDPYVPEDNRSPEELVEAGELPKEMLAVYANSPVGTITRKGAE